MQYNVGTSLNINGLDATVIGFIVYSNPNDGNKKWTDYRLKTSRGECWLSVDDVYNEYSISWPNNSVKGQIGPEWIKVDEGTQVVIKSQGDVDVDNGERASFVEYEDSSKTYTLSVEIWSDGTEFSTGNYINPNSIVVTGYKRTSQQKKSAGQGGALLIFMVVAIVLFGSFVFSAISSGTPRIDDYIKGNSNYEYVTSITGSESQKADVYKYNASDITDNVAKDLIKGIEGETESVTQMDDISNEQIAIVTKKEYCLVYHPEEDPDIVYVQISDRKYNYSSDNAPYHCSKKNTIWYRNHYYSSSYSKDSSSYSDTPSAYSMYNGTTIHNIGNGYFDSYSSSIKQSSVNSRRSSSGGISSGK